MKEHVRKQYKAPELLAVIVALQSNGYHDFSETEARSIVVALHKKGFRIVKVSEGENEP